MKTPQAEFGGKARQSYFSWAPFRDDPYRPKGYTWRDYLAIHLSVNSLPYWWYIEVGPFFIGQEKFD